MERQLEIKIISHYFTKVKLCLQTITCFYRYLSISIMQSNSLEETIIQIIKNEGFSDLTKLVERMRLFGPAGSHIRNQWLQKRQFTGNDWLFKECQLAVEKNELFEVQRGGFRGIPIAMGFWGKGHWWRGFKF